MTGRAMVDRGAGKIINITLLNSFRGGITVPTYTASKAAVAGLTRVLSSEWPRSGPEVKAVAPGCIRTDDMQASQGDERRSAEISARIPAGRWGHHANLAGAAVFLACHALVVRDVQAVLSPGWSIHSDCSTRCYAFHWAMGGTNQDLAYVQNMAMSDLR